MLTMQVKNMVRWFMTFNTESQPLLTFKIAIRYKHKSVNCLLKHAEENSFFYLKEDFLQRDAILKVLWKTKVVACDLILLF